MKHLITLFVDGSEVDYTDMEQRSLIKRVEGENAVNGWALTEFGKSFVDE